VIEAMMGVGWVKLPGNARVIGAAPRNFAHAMTPQDPDAWATRRYAVPNIQCCGVGALPTLRIYKSQFL
jgi:hypothetical protein